MQAILVLQPTRTARQKTVGTYIHSALLLLSLTCFIAAFVIVEISKIPDGPQLHSVHSIMGLITYILIITQALVGIAQFWIPQWVFGSVENGKKIYKYHRISGYVLLVLELATVSAATQTTYNVAVFNIALWAILVSSVVLLLGIGARIKTSKFGF